MKKIYVEPLVKVVKVDVEQGFAMSKDLPIRGEYDAYGVGIDGFSEEDNDGWAF